MNEGTPIVLHSPRLLLRDFEEDDLPAILAYHVDPTVARFWEETRTEDQSRAWLRETIAGRRRTPRADYIFAIIRTADSACQASAVDVPPLVGHRVPAVGGHRVPVPIA